MKQIFLFTCLFFLVSCCPTSQKDFRQEGETLSKKLLRDLQAIQTREQLVKALPILRGRFNDLVNLIMQAQEAQGKYVEEWEEEALTFNEELNFALFSELKRLYGLEGGRELVEKAEREALQRLSSFQTNFTKKRERESLLK